MRLIANVSAVLDEILRMVPIRILDTKISRKEFREITSFFIVATFHLRILR